MKKKDKEELKTKTVEELKTLLKETKDSILKMRFDLSRNKVKNTRLIFLKRKDAARILTVLTDKEVLNAKNA